MKKNTLILGLLITTFSFAVTREVTLETKSIDGVMHWTPKEITVAQGETIKLTAKHELEGGFDFHGLFIPSLKVSRQINRHKPETLEIKIPSDMKPGRYPMGCQFHEKHKPAELVVTDGKKHS